MPPELPSAATPRRFRLSRGAALAVIVWVVLYGLTCLLPQYPDPTLRLGQDLAAPLMLVAACAVFGFAVLEYSGSGWIGPAEQVLAGAGIGLGVLGLATFGLGLAGWMDMRAAPVAMMIVGAPALSRMGAGLRAWWREARSGVGALGWVLAGLALAAGGVMLWVAWAPPIDHDVMTYHLALPKQYLARGRIHETPQNVYNYFPQMAEMLYQAAWSLRWSPATPPAAIEHGALLPKMLNVCIILVAALAVAARAGRAFGALAAAPAAALFVTLPWIMNVAHRPVAEGTQVMFTVLAQVALAIYLDKRRLAPAALAGVMTGFALGAKYSVWPFLLVPMLVIMTADLVLRPPRRLAAKALALYVVLTFVTVGPYLVRNVLWTGNPWHPLLARVFGPGPHWTAAQAEAFSAHHGPEGIGLAAFWDVLRPESVLRAVPTAAVLALAALALMRRPTRRTAVTLAPFAAIIFGVWFFLMRHEPRYLVPFWAPAVVLAAGGTLSADYRDSRGLLVALCGAAAGVGLLFMVETAQQVERQAIVTEVPREVVPPPLRTSYSAPAERYLDRGGDLEGRDRLPGLAVGLVGESATLMYARPVRYNTVWDTPWLAPAVEAWHTERAAEGVRRVLAARGIATIYVNWLEIARFRDTPTIPWPEAIDEALFAAWVEAGILEVDQAFGGHAPLGPSSVGAPPQAHVIYRVRYGAAGG